MDDMHAFERQVARQIQGFAGPVRPVDDGAIVSALAAGARSGRWRLEGALRPARLLVASAVVVSFAALLLVNLPVFRNDEGSLPGAVATAAPTVSPVAEPTVRPSTVQERTTRTDLLPGVTLLTEEVEPDVLRVLNDGVRDLSFVGDGPGGLRTGQDGSVWLEGVESGPIRLGDARVYETDLGLDARVYETDLGVFDDDSDIGPDGTIWSVTEDGALTAFDGESLTRYEAPVGGSIYQVEVTRDGTIWAAWHRGKVRHAPRRVVVGRLDGDAWRIEAERPWDRREVGGISNLLKVSDGGDVWLGLERVKGEALDLKSEMPEEGVGRIFRVGVASDGIVWVQGVRGLARLDATGLTRYDGDDGVPDMYHLGDGSGRFEVSADGSLWVTGQPSSCQDGGTVYHFDGTVWTSYGGDGCVRVIAAAADGALWYIRGSRSGGEAPGPLVEVYVILPGSTRD
jgi:hypothetical protein